MGRRPLPPDQRKPKLSGAQRRKQQYEREEAAAKAAGTKKVGKRAAPQRDPASPTPTDDNDDGDEWAEEFEEAGQIDLNNPDTDLDYVRKLQLIVLRQMAMTAHPSKAQQDTWRRIREMSAVVGMTSNRAKLEADLRALKKTLAHYQEQGGALKFAKGDELKRPPTARGRKRGPRLLPPGELPPTPKG